MEMSLCNSFRSLAVLAFFLLLAVDLRAHAFTVGRVLNATDQENDASSPQEQKNELIRMNEIKYVNAKDETNQLKIPLTKIKKDENVTTTTSNDLEKTVIKKTTINNADKENENGKVNETTSTKENAIITKSMETTTIDSFQEIKTEGSSSHGYSSSADHQVESEPSVNDRKLTTKEPEFSKSDTQTAETIPDRSEAPMPTRPVYSVAVPQEPQAWQNYTSIERIKNDIDDDSSKTETTSSMIPFSSPMTTASEKYEESTISLSSIFTEAPKITTEVQETTTDDFYPIEAEILSTKRGGYLDMSVHDPAKSSVITKIAKKSQVKKKTTPVTTPSTSTTTTTSTTTESPTVNVHTEAPTSTSKKVAGDDAPSQLNEDAIKDELLMEQVLFDNDEFELSKRHSGERSTKYTTESFRHFESSTSGEGSVEDLSVKPISKGSLYTVSPNYKKMKKLEVQAAKPFVRDPDDNSWRNESLSSLGIVFNANNSSKTFTQVIKNKTESVTGSAEINPSSSTPELRQRLEKLAEERKKKKPNKSGEYSEYDEYSYEPYYRQNGGYRSTIAPRKPATEASVRTTEGRKPNVITTQKPRKILNILEYFDTGDDEAFDYVTAPQIDLKKEKTTSRATPPTTTAARIIQEAMRHYPDRKPTLQYFPPRPYSKAPQTIEDDYDNNFKQKIEQYTTTKQTNEEFSTKVTTESYKSVQEYTTPSFKEQKNLDRNFYFTGIGKGAPQSHSYHDNGYSKSAYTIQHLGDAVTEAPSRTSHDFLPRFTALPPPTTLADFFKRMKSTGEDDYVSFKKQVLDNFDGRFSAVNNKPHYPTLYNNSVVHQEYKGGQVLSSSFLRQLYHKEVPSATQTPLLEQTRPPCDGCEAAPATYDLHYYVPDQEERQVVDRRLPVSP